MNEMNFESLLYTGPGTNLEVGLAVGHEWVGGSTNTKKGIPTFPNMSTEETDHSFEMYSQISPEYQLDEYKGFLNEDFIKLIKDKK